MKQINKIAVVMLVAIMMASIAGAAGTEIKAADGTDLPDTTYIASTLAVLITNDGLSVGPGTSVILRQDKPNADPIVATTNGAGVARFKPYVTGSYKIRVLDGTATIAEETIDVIDEPWVPVPTATARPRSSGGGGGGGLLPTPTPTVNATNATDVAPTDVVPRHTIGPVVPEPVVEEPVVDQTIVEKQTLPAEPKTPGFAGVFVILGILIVAYLHYRKKQ